MTARETAADLHQRGPFRSVHALGAGGPDEPVFGLCVCRGARDDGRDLLATSAGSRLQLWDLAYYACRATLQGHARQVRVCFVFCFCFWFRFLACCVALQAGLFSLHCLSFCVSIVVCDALVLIPSPLILKAVPR